MKRFAILLFVAAVFAPTLRGITIHSVSPGSGPSSGGTTVTIKGDFGSWPYGVLFGGVPAQSTTRVAEDTLVAVTPPHLPGVSKIIFFEYDIGIATDATFTFQGGVPPQYERLLLPIFTPPVRGAFGSEFHTSLRMMAKEGPYSISVFGAEPECDGARIFCQNDPIDFPIHVHPGWELRPEDFAYFGKPGRFIYVESARVDALVANLRVQDVSRAQLNFGTEIPIVREGDFVNGQIVLLGVPTDPRFRSTLRVYGTNATFVRVTIDDRPTITLPLRPGATLFDPAYVQFADFPTSGNGTMRVTIEPPVSAAMPPQEPTPYPIWAFITVTNNDTQSITTITPQP